MPGTYAPPAVELPNTRAMVGMPIDDSSVRSWKSWPPGMKISACVGRSAPPDSTRLTTGSRLMRAISMIRSCFFHVYGLAAPPRTVGSLAMITHSTPDTTPSPVTTLPPTAYCVPHAASVESSRNGLSGSSSSSIRSRARSLPRARRLGGPSVLPVPASDEVEEPAQPAVRVPPAGLELDLEHQVLGVGRRAV